VGDKAKAKKVGTKNEHTSKKRKNKAEPDESAKKGAIEDVDGRKVQRKKKDSSKSTSTPKNKETKK